MKVTTQSAILALCALLAPARADRPTDYVASGGCVIRARATVDRAYISKGRAPHPPVSRYSLEIVRVPKNAYHWDLTLAEDPTDHSTNVNGFSRVPYGAKRYTMLHATLHQYDTYEERVVFRNLDLVPLPPRSGPPKPEWADLTPRCLSLKEPMTLTTPSGITITLPAQGAGMLGKVFSNSFEGNANALFIQINTSPDKALVALPKSPLWGKHGKPVRIKLECPPPNFMVWYTADNTFKTIAVGLPHLRTVTHLDALTLIIRQRVDLQSVPISIRVPVTRDAN